MLEECHLGEMNALLRRGVSTSCVMEECFSGNGKMPLGNKQESVCFCNMHLRCIRKKFIRNCFTLALCNVQKEGLCFFFTERKLKGKRTSEFMLLTNTSAFKDKNLLSRLTGFQLYVSCVSAIIKKR